MLVDRVSVIGENEIEEQLFKKPMKFEIENRKKKSGLSDHAANADNAARCGQESHYVTKQQ
jgi:hypothetical protein